MPYNYVFFQIKYWDACEEESISDNYCLTVEEVLHDLTNMFFRCFILSLKKSHNIRLIVNKILLKNIPMSRSSYLYTSPYIKMRCKNCINIKY
jgi:hypothetical protein